MIADKKLQALAVGCSTDRYNAKPALHYVHIKGKKAEATNGHILIQTEFSEFNDDDFPSLKREIAEIENEDVYVLPKQINKVFNNVLKKAVLPVLRCVKIALSKDKKQSLVISTDLESETIACENQDDMVFPNTKKVWPMYDKDKCINVSLSLENLEKLVTLVKATNGINKRITMQVFRPDSGIKFVIPDEQNHMAFRGLVMPLRFDDNSFNDDLEKYLINPEAIDFTKVSETEKSELNAEYEM